MIPVSAAPGGPSHLQGQALSCLRVYLLGPSPELPPSSHVAASSQQVLCAWSGERSPGLKVLDPHGAEGPVPAYFLSFAGRKLNKAPFPRLPPSRVVGAYREPALRPSRGT